MISSSSSPEFTIKNFDNENYFKLRSCFDNMINQNSTINVKNLANVQQKIIENNYPMLTENYKKDLNTNVKNLTYQLALKNNFKKEEEYNTKKSNNNFEDDRLSYLITKSPYYDGIHENYNTIGLNVNNENDKSSLNFYNVNDDEKDNELLGKKVFRKESYESYNSSQFKRNISDLFPFDDGENKNYFTQEKVKK